MSEQGQDRAARVKSGCEPLDALLGGGYERKAITQFYGEPASGKSTFCVISAVACLRTGMSVVFIDSEGFSIERFSQVAGDEAGFLAENLFLYEPADFDQQGIMVAGSETVLRKGHPGLIILDSATGLYRTELDKGREAMQRLTRQMIFLLGLAKRYDIPALITNQVYMDIQRGTYYGLGGTALEHISKAIIFVSRVDDHRRATLVKHRSLAAGKYFDFTIVDKGVESRGHP
jgi:DNA repair protein RadB